MQQTEADRRQAQTDWLPILLFMVGLSGLAFVYGVSVSVYGYFPYRILREARLAYQALQQYYGISLGLIENPLVYTVDHDRHGVSLYDHNRAFNGYTFLNLYRDGQFKAVLIDMNGKTLHEWHAAFSTIWPKAPHIIHQAQDDIIHWHGSHLFPNGDILFNFEGENFPFGGGLVKLDKNSRVLWALPRNTHHDLYVDEDGTIYVPAHSYRTERALGQPYFQPPYYDDYILKISPHGEVLEQISVLEALRASPYRGLLSLTYDDELISGHARGDPTHLNAVEVLPDRWASRFPMFKPGDMLISLRNINTVAIIDSETKVVRWAMTGAFTRQHDPHFLENGRILIYDNGDGTVEKKSRIVEVEVASLKAEIVYQGSKDHPFYTEFQGKVEPLPNGNILVVETGGGRAFEISRSKVPEIVWEYCNRLPAEDGRRLVGSVTAAFRFAPDALAWLDER